MEGDMHAFEELKLPENNIGIHWFGQNSFALKNASGVIIMVDPYFPRERPVGEFIHSAPPVDESEIRIDIVLLTHDHGDHTHPESLLRIHAAHPNVCYYGPAESMTRLMELGVPSEQLRVMAAGDTQQADSITLHALCSKPAAGDLENNIPAPDVEHLGYVIEMGSARVYISGDLIHTFSRHDELLSPIIQLKPDIGFLTTHPTEIEFPDFEGSIEMAVKLGLKVAVPAHYGCFEQRTFAPNIWAGGFPEYGPKPLVIGYNESIIYCL
jgi:L-ascorbate metabolism protein UlaG (beta-lactamase superfamily)